MKRKVLLSLICMFVITTLHAAPITYRQAAERAARFISLKPCKKTSRTIITTYHDDAEIQPYYVFDIGHNEGFVIVSGDDAARPILGYSYEGSFDRDSLPENMKMWLDGYAGELKRIQQLNLPGAKHYYDSNDNKENIPALITARWNQKRPFNNRCPKSKNGKGHRPSGCVAIAIAQVMYYHKWPQGETAAIDGYTYKDEYIYGGDGSLKTEEPLEPTVFDWDSMIDDYEDENMYNNKSADAVAELLQDVGHSVRMTYGVTASAAFSEDIPAALVCTFGYKNTARLERRGAYNSQNKWENLIYRELSENRPVVYSGVTKMGSGHQFVCDGYENGYFHINWGWGGTSNGYFVLSVLDPYDQGIGGAGVGSSFSEHQTAVIGIQRPDESDVIYADGVMAEPGEEFSMNIMMSNVHRNYTSLQFDLQMPQGTEILKDNSGALSVSFNQLRSENGDHCVNIRNIADNKYRIVVYSPTNAAITNKEGAIISISAKISDTMQKGCYYAKVNNVTVCDQDLNTNNFCDRTSDFNIVADKTLTGDSNNDGKVNIADVDCTINDIMQKQETPFIKQLADVDADDTIDITDVMLTQDIILKNAGAERNIFKTEPDSTDALSFNQNDKVLSLVLKNNTCYKAVQMDVVMPENVSVTYVVTSDIRTKDFNVIYDKVKNDIYRIILYSADSNNIEGSEGTVADIMVSGTVDEAEIKNIVCVTSSLDKVLMGRYVYKLSSGIENVIIDERKEDTIYSLQGLRIKKQINQLPKGIYIVNGKKIIIE